MPVRVRVDVALGHGDPFRARVPDLLYDGLGVGVGAVADDQHLEPRVRLREDGRQRARAQEVSAPVGRQDRRDERLFTAA